MNEKFFICNEEKNLITAIIAWICFSGIFLLETAEGVEQVTLLKSLWIHLLRYKSRYEYRHKHEFFMTVVSAIAQLDQ